MWVGGVSDQTRCVLTAPANLVIIMVTCYRDDMTTMTEADPTVTERVYEIPTSRVDDAKAAVEKVNRRLRRLHLPEYRITTAPADTRPVYDDRAARTVINGVPHTIEQGRPVPCPIIGWEAHTTVTIIGEVPRLGDYEPVAVLTREQGGPVVTRVWPGLAVEPDLSAFRGTDPICEHCHKDRERTDTFVVRHRGTGQMLQVGRTCLAAFTGIRVNIPTWALGEGDEDQFGLSGLAATGDDRRWMVIDVITAALAATAMWGWVSRQTERESLGQRLATAERVRTVLGTGTASADMHKAMEPHLAQAATLAPTVLALAQGLADTESGEYAANLSTVARETWVTPRNLALLASAVAVYHRRQEQQAQARDAAHSTWQGQLKQRREWTLTVVSETAVESDWGISTRFGLVDEAGNRFGWFASNAPTMDVGDTVVLKGTVKAHELYREVQITQLTRCQLVSRTPAPAGQTEEPNHP